MSEFIARNKNGIHLVSVLSKMALSALGHFAQWPPSTPLGSRASGRRQAPQRKLPSVP